MTYHHCPLCGKAYPEKAYSEQKFHCQKCFYDFYINPKPCNGLFIENDRGELLLIKRKYDPDKGKWDVPGGFVDQGENLEQSTVREAREELGIEIKDLKYIGSYPDTYEYQKVTHHSLIFMMSGVVQSGNIKAQDDAETFAFFPKDQLPWDSLAFTFLIKALKDYLAKGN
jgi:ADP-ribose pyrophosphatase YjhB (NUDIX family)